MKHLFRILFWFLCFSTIGMAQSSVILGGTITNPETGALFNGYIKVNLMKSGMRNTCTPPPYQIVPTISRSYKVTNGALVNPNGDTWYVSQDCMSPRIPYYVEFDDANHEFMYYANWYLPLNPSETVNVGQMVSTGFGGPIVVSIPQAIVANPFGNQTINQPGSSALIVNNLTVTGILNIPAGTVPEATVATQLVGNPTVCATGLYAIGISPNGNAQCTSFGTASNTFNWLKVVNNAGSSYTAQGLYLGWNFNIGDGRTDFINERGVGLGGFNFYDMSAGTLSPTGSQLIVQIDHVGNIYAASFNGLVTQATHSNTSDALSVAPTGCGANQALVQIGPKGNPANCITVASSQTTDYFRINVCPTGMGGTGGGSFCTGNATFASVYPAALASYVDGNYNLQCTFNSTNCASGTCIVAMSIGVHSAGSFNYTASLVRGNTSISQSSTIGQADCSRRHY